MSGARQVSGSRRQRYATVTPSCSARSVIDFALPRSIRRRHRCARTSLTLGTRVSPAQVTLCLIDLKLARLLRTPRSTWTARSIWPATPPAYGRLADERPSRRAERPREAEQGSRAGSSRRSARSTRTVSIVVHHRLVDTLGRMLKSGTIDQAMHDAGEGLRGSVHHRPASTRSAHFRSSPGSGNGSRPGSERSPSSTLGTACTRRCRRSAASQARRASCVWHVVGLQRSVREWAIRQGWRGRPLDHKEAKGIRWRRWGAGPGTSATAK